MRTAIAPWVSCSGFGSGGSTSLPQSSFGSALTISIMCGAMCFLRSPIGLDLRPFGPPKTKPTPCMKRKKAQTKQTYLQSQPTVRLPGHSQPDQPSAPQRQTPMGRKSSLPSVATQYSAVTWSTLPQASPAHSPGQ